MKCKIKLKKECNELILSFHCSYPFSYVTEKRENLYENKFMKKRFKKMFCFLNFKFLFTKTSRVCSIFFERKHLLVELFGVNILTIIN